MIIKASQRGGASALATHLMNGHDNEHVEVHCIQGFLGGNVQEAFEEIEALSKGTRCTQYLFSVSLSPPPKVKASTQLFERTIERIAKANGLENQPHVVVFHEKHGRRHAHCVWSRIDNESLRAINLPYFKNRLMEIGKAIYLEQGWTLPNGHIDKTLSNPLNYTLAEWQQAKRQKLDPKQIKAEIKALWDSAKTKQSFEKALNDRGYYLACGNPRRSFVFVDWAGQVRSLSRHTGAKAKVLNERLGSSDTLPSVDTLKQQLAERLDNSIKNNINALHQNLKQRLKPLEQQKRALKRQHQQARRALKEQQNKALIAQRQTQQKHLLKGLRGWWQRFTGERLRLTRKHEQEALRLHQHNQRAMDALIYKHIEQRQMLEQLFAREIQRYEVDIEQFKTRLISHGQSQTQRHELEQRFLSTHKSQGWSLDL